MERFNQFLKCLSINKTTSVQSQTLLNITSDYSKKYPIHTKTITNDITRLEFYFDSGLSPNVRDHEGNTPLFKTFFTNNTKLVYLLLLYGANPLLSNNEEMTPFEVAILMGYKEMIEMMLMSGIDLYNFKNRKNILGSVLSMTGNNKGNSILELLLALNYNLNQFIIEGASPLHFAVIADNIDAASILLLNGTDPNYRDAFGKTALEATPPKYKKEFQQILENEFPFSLKRLCLFRIRLMMIRERFLLNQGRFTLEKEEKRTSMISLD